MEREKSTEEIERKDASIISKFQRGIVYETRADFSNSVFNKVYKRAYALVDKDVQIQLRGSQEVAYKSTPNNIITFVGRRGTGKSSAMQSFMHALLNNTENPEREPREYTIYDNSRNPKPVQFIGIDWIDASLLEKGEDIFEVILAKMLKVFLEDIESESNERLSYEKRTLYNSFADIYKKQLNIKKQNDNYYSAETAISSLRDLSRSVDIKDEFQKLVYNFINIKSGNSRFERNDLKETFLVVAIDDIDMNIDSGFEILEKIQRYLSVDRFLILLAVNHEQMQMCCQKHFVELHQIPLGHLSANEYSSAEKLRSHVKDIAEQYMEKALPFYTRIYLPSLKKMDYDRNHLTKIQIELKNGKKKTCSIKQAAFILAARKTMVRYDKDGIKRHFMEPETLRELSDYWLFRETMADLVEKDEDDSTSQIFLENLDLNFRRSMDDLLFRYAEEKLSEFESDIFIRLSETNLQRRGRDVIFALLREASVKKDLLSDDAASDWNFYLEKYKEFGYSYGELLHCLHRFGQTGMLDKRLIHAILAMYSLTMTKIFYRYKINESDKAGNNYKMLKQVLENSVVGSWGLDILPKVHKSHDTNAALVYAGACKNIHMNQKRLLISEKVEELIYGVEIEIQKESETYSDEKNKISDTLINQIASLLEHMEWQFILMMFLSSAENVSYIIEKSNDKVGSNIPGGFAKTEKEASIYFQDGMADYSALNFINNLFFYKENLVEFIKMLLRALELQENPSDIKKIYDKVIEHDSGFYNEIAKWHKKYGGMVVPLYDTDLYYNLIKRIAREQKNQDSIAKEQVYDCFIVLLEEIFVRLKENDEYYVEYEKFADIFTECPVIKKLKEPDTIKRKIYTEFIWELINGNNVKTKEISMKNIMSSF